MPDDRKIRLGGLWKHQARSGETYYSGSFGPGLRLVLFSNTRQQNDKDPDLVLYLAPADQPARDPRAPGRPEPGGLADLEFPG